MRVVTFGEAMLRFSPPADSSLEKAESYAVEVAGAEANVAAALARLGVAAVWVSRLADNALGRRVAARLRQHGVDTSQLIWSQEGRVGLYFVEVGLPPRPPHVIYDRAGSAFAAVSPDEIDPAVLDGADLLHLTSITLALGAGCRQAMEALVQEAEAREVPVSFDLNYRAKLWTVDEAREACEPFLSLARLLFVSTSDAAGVLGVEARPERQARTLGDRYPRATVVVTAGEAGAWAWDGALHHRPAVSGIEVDRVGRGDAFAAGFIFGRDRGDVDFALACGTALAALAQTYAGDQVWATAQDVLDLASGREAGRFR